MRVLCFGDSNTWGYISGSDHERYDVKTRWPKVLAGLLGNEHEVIEEGLNSRTISLDDPRPGKEGKSSMPYIRPCLDSHDPLDWVIVMLGTNDMKDEYALTPQQISENLLKILEIISNRESQCCHKTPRLMVVSPPQIDSSNPYAANRFKTVAGNKPHEFGELVKKLCATYGWSFLDGRELETGPDGVHITARAHAQLAKMVFEKLTALK